MYISAEGGELEKPSTTGRKKMTKLFDIKIHVKKKKIDAFFDLGS